MGLMKSLKMWRGGDGYANIFSALEKNAGGGFMSKYFMDVKESCGVRPKYFMGLIKYWGGGDGYAKILSAFEKNK